MSKNPYLLAAIYLFSVPLAVLLIILWARFCVFFFSSEITQLLVMFSPFVLVVYYLMVRVFKGDFE